MESKTSNKIHIVTAFSRVHLFSTLIEMLRPFNIEWNLIVSSEIKEKVYKINTNNNWVNIINYTPPDNWDKCYSKFNYFIKNENIVEDDYYIILNDDDALESNVIDEIRKMKDEIVVLSMKRGDNSLAKFLKTLKLRVLYYIKRNYNLNIPLEMFPHSTSTLYASPDNMKIGHIGPEQIIYKGKIFKTLQFKNTSCADGMMAENIFKNYKKITYRPDLFVLFNYYEPGRWKIC